MITLINSSLFSFKLNSEQYIDTCLYQSQAPNIKPRNHHIFLNILLKEYSSNISKISCIVLSTHAFEYFHTCQAYVPMYDP